MDGMTGIYLQTYKRLSLSEHLLSGLSTTGVPKSMAGCSLPFSYNKVDELHSLLKENEIGAIIMEVSCNISHKIIF